MIQATQDSLPVAYFDHGASSWPKPAPVVDAVVRALTEFGGNPGRGTHAMALQASREILAARGACAALLGVSDSRDLLFQPSCTVACNLMLKGLLGPGDRVVVGSMEHNAVARPLARLAEEGVEAVVVQADATGFVDPDDVERVVRAAATRAVICQHVSNLTGTVQPIGALTDIAHEHGALMLVDGAQGAGHLEADLGALAVDAYATSGHKGLLGPQGIGLLCLSPTLDLRVLVEGGTGGGSSGSLSMPTERPDRYEAGTANVPGIAGVGAAARLLAAEGAQQRESEQQLARTLHEGLLEIGGFRVLGPPSGVERAPIVSIVHDRVEADRIAFKLDRIYRMACRSGLHCAPWAHESVGTIGCGAVRFGIGWGNTAEQVESLLTALAEIVS